MIYQIAEKFKSIQGEGAYVGTPMAFIRFVGCSVGKRVCHVCDTDFEKMHSFRGGGAFTQEDLIEWVGDAQHICLTGGEPLDQELEPLIALVKDDVMVHVETSGTVPFPIFLAGCWVCVSPKPGYIEEAVMAADEIKVIVPGLGSGEGWPTLHNALHWAELQKLVYLQPRNGKFDIDAVNLRIVQDAVMLHPTLRLSVQTHKILKVQ